MTSSRMVVTLPSVYQVIRTNMIPSYRTINRITQLIVYAGNNSVVVILVGTDGHGHDNIHIIISYSSYCSHRLPVRYIGWKVEERGKRDVFVWHPNHLIQEHTKMEKREIYCLLSCPWIGNSYSSSRRERRGRCSGIIIIRIVRTIHNSLHPAYNTDIDNIMNGRYTVTCVPIHSYQHDTVI